MREIYPIIFGVLIVALLVCSFIARRSPRSIGKTVAMLLGVLVPPMAGNLIIILSESPTLTYIGCLLYFLGMNCVMFGLLRFAVQYCMIPPERAKLRFIAYAFLILDSISILLNYFFGHAFSLEQIEVSGQLYYRFVPLIGQTIHRAIDYGILFVVLLIFFVKMVRSARVYLERYAVIFGAMIIFGIWQSYYIFSRTPIDRSMIGFGVFGLLVFFFSILYRPMRLLDRLLITMASDFQEALLFFDLNMECIWANEQGQALLGIDKRNLTDATSKLRRMFGPPTGKSGEDWNEQKTVIVDGEVRHYYLQKRMVYDRKERLSGSFINLRDNTAEKEELKKERYNATHDASTGLYNRAYLYEMIQEKLEKEPEKNWYISIASIDGFEVITDVYGTAFGERALSQIAEWIGVDMPKDSVYGRLSETEFGALVVGDLINMDHLEHDLSHTVVRADNVEQHVFIHFGIYRITDPGLEISVMFDRARLALTRVRDNLTRYVGFYEDTLRDDILWNHQISAELQEALEQRQIVPYLQPIMDASGNIAGAEVLARWHHPTEGFLQPGSFIPVFEKNGLIAEIDRYMWRCACEIIAQWERERRDIFLSVNISPKDFDVMDVVAEIKGLVNEYGISPEHLRLEITETALGINQESRMRILSSLRAEGFMIEMDDFGSGYSSMNLLKDMPLDLVKLDMVFLRKSSDSERAKKIIQMIILLTQQLGILSLMEGVENDQQYHILSEMGCQYFQGFYFSKPIPVSQFLEELQ